MDKLEPVIRHKFWIIFGLTLPMALFAYYSASGKMAEATTAQESKLDSTLSGIPSGDADPNETYAADAKVINEELAKRFDVQVQKLWELQTDWMTWPKVVVPYIPATYRGEIDRKARYTYMRVYPSVIQRLWERVQPYVGDVNTNPALAAITVDWPQKVIIDGHSLPHASFNMSLPADNKDIWDAQEDIWLLELIFDAVVRTNEDANFVSDSPVRQIDKITLVGGSGESSVTAAPVAALGGEEYQSYQSSDYGADYGGFGGGGATGLGGPAKTAFNVAEEFGAPIPEPSDAIAAPAASLASGDGEYGSYGSGYGGMARGAKMQRYIGASGADPFEEAYRERGFYMSVIILQDRIPDFFAELSSSPWPIRIGRFHIGPNPHAPKTPTGGYGGGAGFAFGYAQEMSGAGESYGAYENYGDGGGFGMGFGSYGMEGGGASKLKLPDFMKMPTSIDPGLRGSPELVQLDFCGIITMYNPVTDDSVDVVDDGSTEEDFAEALENSAETPEEAQKMQEAEPATGNTGENAAAPAGDAAISPPAPAAAPGAEPAPADDTPPEAGNEAAPAPAEAPVESPAPPVPPQNPGPPATE